MIGHVRQSGLPLRRCWYAGLVAAALCLGVAQAEPLRPLKLEGARFVDQAGQPVTLRGVNLGNWFLLEPWMLELRDERIRDQHDILSLLERRFGAARTKELLEVYRANWITAREFEHLKAFGFNLIRLPFHFSLLTDETGPLALHEDAFRWLDHAVKLAEAAGFYVVLDLHGAPGGQSVDMPSGRVEQNELWTSRAHQERLVWLWREIARHYRSRAGVIAYDLINEPWSDFRQDVRPALLKLMPEVLAAIREVDPETLVFFPGTLRGIAFYGDPRERDWKNVGYTEHHYPGLFGNGPPTTETHRRYLTEVLPAKARLMQQWQVPYLNGEFNVVFERCDQNTMMRAYFDLGAEHGWLTTMWSARKLSPEGGIPKNNWTLITNAEPYKVPDLFTASFDEIRHAFETLGTQALAVDEPLRVALTREQQRSTYMAGLTEPVHNETKRLGALPGWTSINLSTGKLVECVRKLEDGIEVVGVGADIWGPSDDARFIYQPREGNVSIGGRIDAIDAARPLTKAGWMLRAGPEADAAHAFVHAFPSGRVIAAVRSETGAETLEQALGVFGFPVELSLERHGQRIQARIVDHDGVEHVFPFDFAPLQLPDRILAGLCVNSRDDATRSHVRISGWPNAVQKRPAKPRRGRNVLTNGSFEQAAAEGQSYAPAGWQRWGAQFARETGWETPRDGDALLGYRHWQVDEDDSAGWYQDLRGVQTGDELTFGVYVCADPITDQAHLPRSVEMRIESRANERVLHVASQSFNGQDLLTAPHWSYLEVSGVLPYPSARVLILVNPSSDEPRGSALKFDQAMVHVTSRTPLISRSHHPKSDEEESR